MSVATDVELVKAALLYADRVELVSPGAVMVAAVDQLAAGDGSDVVEMLGQLDADTLRAMGVDNVDGLRQATPLLSMLAPHVEQVQESMAQLRTVADEVLDSSQANELVPAIEAGVLSLSPSGFSDAVENIDETFERYLQMLKRLLRNRHTRLLFDDQIAGLVRAMVNEGEVTVPDLTVKHAAEAALGSGFIARLATFPEASIHELLDLRRDLADPLTRYRKGILAFERRLSAGPFGPDLGAELDDLWREDVEPVLLEISEGFAEHGLVREVSRSPQRDIGRLLTEGAAFYVGFDRLATLDDWVSALAAVAAPMADAVVSGARNSQDQRRQLEKRELYFLYELERRLT